jgi:spore coat polysaccharide biosynthesis predicted glycosyltransferase SpsG
VSTSTENPEIGVIVDAGSKLGYGHVVRSVRLARALARRNRVAFYPLSAACKSFVEAAGFRTAEIGGPFPPLVITDLREAHGITATIRRHGSRHISIHDLGLAQCHSDVAIDGSVTRLFPYTAAATRELFLGPQYMITREPVRRSAVTDTVLVTCGGGSTARFATGVAEQLLELGLNPVTTHGFLGSKPLTDAKFAEAMATCCFAISGSGVTLYDLLASGVPTVAIAFDRIQLRTADAFHELGAVLSAGLMERLSPNALVRYCKDMIENGPLVQRITQAGQMLVDGKGLSRVVEIVRRQLWLTSQEKTYTAC